MVNRAFLCGINNYKSISDLRGCVNDTLSIKKLLVEEFGFKEVNIELRHDNEVTKQALVDGWKWLLKGAKKGDSLVFHFSGHGSYTVDREHESSEADKKDELLCLYGMDWKDPDTYLLDDEIAKWTMQIPDGVQVTFLLDCCHSGTGTRFIAPELTRAVKSSFLQAGAHSLDDIATRRFKQLRSSGSRSVERSDGLRPPSVEAINEQTVLARFAPPPVEIQNSIGTATEHNSFARAISSSTSRSIQSMNHVLWSGCRDDQTSADAYIKNGFHGAFSFYLCESIRSLGTNSSSAKIIKKLRAKLRLEQFTQVPQLEPEDVSTTVFGGLGTASANTASPPKDESDDAASDISNLPLDRAELEQLSSLVQRFLQQTGGQVGVGAIPTRSKVGDKRGLVYIHGICSHDKGYSDPWWDALQSHLNGDIRSKLADCRQEVLWSKHVTSGNRGIRSEADSEELSRLQATIEAVLEDRMAREASNQIVESRSSSRSTDGPQQVNRALLGIPGLDCADDFMKYLVSDSIRAKVVGEATRVLAPLLAEGRSIELVSHSWGTIVAYEALHQLESHGLPGRVHNWFTVGAALAISFVAKRLRPAPGAKPHFVDNWININAKGDFVGGSIVANGLRPDEEYMSLKPVGCKSFLGVFSPSCAHSSYFDSDNQTVNKDIFGKWIQEQ